MQAEFKDPNSKTPNSVGMSEEGKKDRVSGTQAGGRQGAENV